MIHIGKEIEKVFTKKGMKISVFATKLNTVPRNIYNIFTRESVDTDTLYKISIILQFDFFRLYYSPKLTDPLIKNPIYFAKEQGKKISVTIEIEEETTKNEICRILNIPTNHKSII